MSRFDSAEARDHLTRFRDRLTDIGVESAVVQAGSVADELESRLEYPAVGSPVAIPGGSLPAAVEAEPTIEELKQAGSGVTPALLGVASQGSIVVTLNAQFDGPVSLYPPKHIAVLEVSDIVPDIGTALDHLAERFVAGENDAMFITGPSSTGDMGESVVGVHGPAELEVLLVE